MCTKDRPQTRLAQTQQKILSAVKFSLTAIIDAYICMYNHTTPTAKEAMKYKPLVFLHWSLAATNANDVQSTKTTQKEEWKYEV